LPILCDDVIKSIVELEQHNPWVGTPFENYKQLNNVQKGNVGEKIVKTYMANEGHNVENRKIRTDGYDVFIDGIKTEIKFSLAQTDTKNKKIKNNVFIINHVSSKKDWERLIFLGINLNQDYYFKFFTKEDFVNYFKGKYFSGQQGGSSSGNDDYICSGNKLIEMLNEMKDITEW